MTPPAPSTADDSPAAAEFLLQGCVQGVGVRPAVARLAIHLGLCGTVGNGLDGVAIHVEGTASQLDRLAERLPTSMPDGATVRQIVRRPATVAGWEEFRIQSGGPGRRLATVVPPDAAVCTECLSDVDDSRNRRAGYAFVTCTNCGPRYSIIETMPYEREQTAMRVFEQCPQCQTEYQGSADRRFHSQTNACPACGPQMGLATPPRLAEGQGTYLLDAGGFAPARISRVPPEPDGTGGSARADATNSPLEAATAVLRRGGIVALKGIGGFQLLCDAADDSAVRRLRQRKRRAAKPLAVMVEPQRLSGARPEEQAAIRGSAGAIVLIDGRVLIGLSQEIAPGLETVGVMRPTSPLHALLLRSADRPLVVTSGNVDGHPLAYDSATAPLELQAVADLILDHNRTIVRPVDDSVVHCIAGREVTIRAARGIAPLLLPLASDRQVLAVGGHQKGAIALSNGRQCVLGPHLGDLDTTAARERYVEQAQALQRLYDVQPELVAHDLHPDYFTTRWSATLGIPTMAVQHHHAHIAAGMLEHAWLDREVLGIAFDGTGLGSDGTIWGGEFLRATSTDVERVGSLRPFPLLGGEQAIREPWRIGFCLVADACGWEAAVQCTSRRIDQQRLTRLLPMLRRGGGLRTTSVGRLFDGVAALVLGVSDSSFEGQPAMMLEAACDRSVRDPYELPVREEAGLLRLDWRPVVTAIVDDLQRQTAAGRIAMRFHRAVAEAVRVVAVQWGELPVVLGGGCFQNRVLTELVYERLEDRQSPVGLPGRIPPNDGGLSAGQLAIAAARLDRGLDRNRKH